MTQHALIVAHGQPSDPRPAAAALEELARYARSFRIISFWFRELVLKVEAWKMSFIMVGMLIVDYW